MISIIKNTARADILKIGKIACCGNRGISIYLHDGGADMRIGIFGAVQQEVALIQEQLQGSSIQKANLIFYEGKLHNHEIVLVCGGVGKVNAALCTQILISEFKVDALINTGAGGGTADNIEVFDMVISTDTVQHDVDATAFGCPRGLVPNMDSAFWRADENLRNLAMKAFALCKEQYADEMKNCEQAVEGRIASGDIFVADAKLREKIIKEFEPLCVEMEGAAIAQTAAVNNVPFIILRCISDNAGKHASAKIAYDEFSKEAAKISALIVLEMLKLL
ncbi:5'-methylthioadenosine/S-adenosylhomocysteine nucleosidase [Treponema phagedenis]|uniref:adenosylhomocysteine nucleosidase n=2 Tax=Treponema phagedenis TaxID=162 RepID=A0A0B7H290_TREPH|nr:MTA/SAH nucleosidase [Treponema phagedenis F0421]CEM63046.1 5'-methylthioadenosine/S-adenosylhomocysteine nucleosidase [Treponema phagedenis]